jgi:hypothetical protein
MRTISSTAREVRNCAVGVGAELTDDIDRINARDAARVVGKNISGLVDSLD